MPESEACNCQVWQALWRRVPPRQRFDGEGRSCVRVAQGISRSIFRLSHGHGSRKYLGIVEIVGSLKFPHGCSFLSAAKRLFRAFSLIQGILSCSPCAASRLKPRLMARPLMSAWRGPRNRAWRLSQGHGDPIQADGKADGKAGGKGYPMPAEAEDAAEASGDPKRRWRRKDAFPAPVPPPPELSQSSARVVWLLGNRCVELLLPTGRVRCSTLPVDIKAGSRSVTASVPGRVYVLENGSSRVWQVQCRGFMAWLWGVGRK